MGIQGKVTRPSVSVAAACVALICGTAAAGPRDAPDASSHWDEPSAEAARKLDESFREVVGLREAGSPRLSPDGRWIAFTVSSTDWDDNRFDSEIWIAPRGGEPYPLTRTSGGSSTGHEFSPDGRLLAFLADRGDGRQIWLIRPNGGEAWPLTAVEEGVGSFDISPDGERIAFTATDPASDRAEAVDESYGDWHVEDEEFRMTHLWIVDVADDPGEEAGSSGARRLTGGGDFTVGNFDWSPDGASIVFDQRPTPQVDSWIRTDVSIVDVESGEVGELVANDGPDSDPRFSPDGTAVVFTTSAGADPYYGNRELALVPAAGGEERILTSGFDENPWPVAWNEHGFWFVAPRRTRTVLFHLEPETASVTPVLSEPESIGWTEVAGDGSRIVFAGSSRDTLDEIWSAELTRTDGGWSAGTPERITDLTAQVEGWPLGTREVISWTSEDGTEIEGVLYLPPGFDRGPDPAAESASAERRPLLVIVHGGPTATSRPRLISSYVYPVTQWLQKGAVILQPNYRGSAGYGAEFRALNVRNLGVGDMWDVMSGVRHLIDEGIADPDRLGAMGWSQGGYISAFLATHTDRFGAISVGAGISDWMTYYVNTDIHGFTRAYLQATPWEDPEIYERTSPIGKVTEASTPTLIQHGEHDARVPTPNAYELYQGLKDQGVETELIIYEGFGHGIGKPKERLAATWHNWQWFARHLWGEEWEMPVDPETSPESSASRNSRASSTSR